MGPFFPFPAMQRQRLWLILHLGLGLAWIALLASRAPGPSGLGATGPQVAQMLLGAGWLPSLALACWQVNHRQWQALLLSDLLAAGLLTLVAFTLYLPLFFFNVAWFLPLALLPRGLLSEGLVRLLTGRQGRVCLAFGGQPRATLSRVGANVMAARDVAQHFATLIAQGDLASAIELLTDPGRSVHTPEAIKAAVAAMLGGTTGPIRTVRVVEEGTVEDWPGKQPGDVAIVYVALNGDGFSEAVTVTVVEQHGRHLISQLEWGRP